MNIRKSTPADLPAILDIYRAAREFMQQNGNPNQWKQNHPPQDAVEADIRSGESYVCECDGQVLAVFYFSTTPDPTYAKIDGAWLNNQPYAVVHRIARAQTPAAKGIGAFCLNWCYQQLPNTRIDTHKDNIPMVRLLENLGFQQCGIIWLANGEERLAFHRA
ncbi:MAG: GNAT family N-acetyltransferase [Defluviitaleaceae bacterium]|nr:GNAT family N-acetyltransferase [Defluviitaleaceae bacterium]